MTHRTDKTTITAERDRNVLLSQFTIAVIQDPGSIVAQGVAFRANVCDIQIGMEHAVRLSRRLR
jgi:hypothetical protein